MGVDRMITIGADSTNFEQVLGKLSKSSEDMYSNILKKAEDYSKKLNLQSVRAQNLIDKEKQIKQLMADQRRETLETERDMKMADLDKGDDAFDENKKQILKDYKDEMNSLNREMREYGMIMGDVNRKTREHFASAGSKQGSRGGGISQGALAGGMTGAMTGGGMGGLASTLVGGTLGLLPLGIGTGASILGGGITGALFSQGGRLAGAEASLRAQTGAKLDDDGNIVGGMTTPDLARLGMDRATTAARQRQLNMIAGSAVGGAQVKDISRMEKGFGMDAGSMNQFAGLRAVGVTDDVDKLAGRFYGMALKSDLWNVQSGDLSAMNRELSSLHSLMSAESSVLATPSGLASINLRTAFAGLSADLVGGLFSGARGQGLMMGINQSLQSPANKFQQALSFEAILKNNPELGLSPVGLTKARAIQSRGIFGKGLLSGTLEQIRDMTEDPEMRQTLLVNRFQNLLPFMGSQELTKMFDPKFIKSMGQVGNEEQMREAMLGSGFEPDAMNKMMAGMTGVSDTDRLNAETVDLLQTIGSTLTEGVAGGILKMLDFFKEDFAPMMNGAVDKMGDTMDKIKGDVKDEDETQ